MVDAANCGSITWCVCDMHTMLRSCWEAPKTKVRIGHPSGAARRWEEANLKTIRFCCFFFGIATSTYKILKRFLKLKPGDWDNNTWKSAIFTHERSGIIKHLLHGYDLSQGHGRGCCCALGAPRVAPGRHGADGPMFDGWAGELLGWWLGSKVFQRQRGWSCWICWICCLLVRHTFPGQYGRSLPSDEHFQFQLSLAPIFSVENGFAARYWGFASYLQGTQKPRFWKEWNTGVPLTRKLDD